MNTEVFTTGTNNVPQITPTYSFFFSSNITLICPFDSKKAYEKNKGKYKLDGFRQGKIPRKVLEKTYGEYLFYLKDNAPSSTAEIPAATEDTKVIRLSTTTSVNDSGLLT